MTANPCQNCSKPRPPGAYYKGWRSGLCKTCYCRWLDAGRPPSGPPPARRVQRVGGRCDGRIEDYLDLRMWGLSKRQAAERLGVTVRTIERYEHRLGQELAA